MGIAHNVFEKMQREKDRKERMKKYEDWQKEKQMKKKRLSEMQKQLKEAKAASSSSSSAGGGKATSAGGGEMMMADSFGDDSQEEVGSSIEGSPPGRGRTMTSMDADGGERIDDSGGEDLEGDGAGPAAAAADKRHVPDDVVVEEKTPKCGKCVIQ